MFYKIAFLVGILSFPIQAQELISLQGSITSNNEPVPFANVVVSGTTKGVAADLNGFYSLKVPSKPIILLRDFPF